MVSSVVSILVPLVAFNIFLGIKDSLYVGAYINNSLKVKQEYITWELPETYASNLCHAKTTERSTSELAAIFILVMTL